MLQYIPPIMCGWEYFPNRRGLVSGIIVGGFGLGAFIFGFVAAALVNPNGLNPDLSVTGGEIFKEEEVYSRVPKMLRFLSLIWAVLALIGIGLVRKKKPREQEKEEKAPFINTPISGSGVSGTTSPDLAKELRYKKAHEKPPPISAAVKSLKFWHIFGMMLCSSCKP